MALIIIMTLISVGCQNKSQTNNLLNNKKVTAEQQNNNSLKKIESQQTVQEEGLDKDRISTNKKEEKVKITQTKKELRDQGVQKKESGVTITTKNKADDISVPPELNTNMRIAISVAEAWTLEYEANDAGAKNLEKAIAEKLKETGLRNPYTKSQNIVSAKLSNGNSAGFAYETDNNEKEDAKYDLDTTANVGYAGVIKYDAYVSGNVLHVKFTPIGANGLPLPGKTCATL